jgi:ribosome-associated translation inhibitor RaiA
MNSYFGYLKAALTSQYNLLVLAGAGMISLISGNFIPLFVALGGEAIWLAAAPLTPAYRGMVDKKLQKHARIDADDEMRRITSELPADLRMRFETMLRQVGEIRSHNEAQGAPSHAVMERTTERLDDMLRRYSRMLHAHNRWLQHAASGNRKELEQRLAALGDDTTGDSEIAAARLQQRRILEQRLEKLDKAERDNTLLETQIATLEDAMGLLRDQALTLRDPGEMTAHLDGFLTEVEVTEQTVSALESSFAALFDRELKQAEEARRIGDSTQS